MLDYYRTQSQWTDPGKNEAMFRGIPDDVPSIVKAVQGVLIHGAHAWRYGATPSKEQIGGESIRRTEELLRRIRALQDAPLSTARTPDKRLLVNCRQFAALTCAILRHENVPARVRAGFALYTWGHGKYENHWICEYWKADEQRWVKVDAQMDDVQKKAMRIGFNTLDVPAAAFVCPGEGWQRYRDGKVELDAFGLGMPDGWKGIGWGMLVGTTMTDVMALNKMELLPWDLNPYWQKTKDQVSEADVAMIEKAALFSRQVDSHWDEMRKFFDGQPLVQMPAGFDKEKPSLP